MLFFLLILCIGACDLRMQNTRSWSQTGLLQVQLTAPPFFFLPNGFVNVGHSITLLLSLQSMKNFGLDHVMRIYLKGLSAENPQAAAEVNTSV